MSIREMASQFKPVVKRSSRTTKIVVCVAILLSVVTILVLHSATLDAQAKAEAWRQKAQQLEQANQKLEEKIENLGTLEGIKDIAQDELGMKDHDNIILEPEN